MVFLEYLPRPRSRWSRLALAPWGRLLHDDECIGSQNVKCACLRAILMIWKHLEVVPWSLCLHKSYTPIANEPSPLRASSSRGQSSSSSSWPCNNTHALHHHGSPTIQTYKYARPCVEVHSHLTPWGLMPATLRTFDAKQVSICIETSSFRGKSSWPCNNTHTPLQPFTTFETKRFDTGPAMEV